MKLRNSVFVLLVIFALAPISQAQDHWVVTWAAAPQQVRVIQPQVAAQAGGAAAPAPQRGQGAPGAVVAPTAFNDQTVRMIVHTALGGRRVRVTLSNSFGNAPLKIGAAHVMNGRAAHGIHHRVIPANCRLRRIRSRCHTFDLRFLWTRRP